MHCFLLSTLFNPINPYSIYRNNKQTNVTFVCFSAGYQWRQCIDFLQEMDQRHIQKNVIIYGAAISCMEKSCKADIAFRLMDQMKDDYLRPNVHIYNSVISACARCNLPEKGYQLYLEMEGESNGSESTNEGRVKRDFVTYNAVLDAVVCGGSDNTKLARELFREGLARGFYSKVSRLGKHWLELDLHFLSLGGGEAALGWWFEECLVPYLGDSDKLAEVKSIDIVTGYGRSRSVRCMLFCVFKFAYIFLLRPTISFRFVFIPLYSLIFHILLIFKSSVRALYRNHFIF